METRTGLQVLTVTIKIQQLESMQVREAQMTDLVHASQNSYSFSVVSCHKEHISDLLLPSLGIESGK